MIVGAGSAGCVLAGRLSEDRGTRVLLLEAGPPDRRREIRVPAAFSTLYKSEVDWAYETTPQAELEGRAVFQPRGKTLGGSSSINAQMVLRGHRADYDRWAALGNPGWSYADVLPYFKKAERNGRGSSAFHGDSGPRDVTDLREPNPLTRAFVRGCVEAGIPQNDDLNGAEFEGAGFVQVTQRKSRRWSAADAYLRPALGRPNLTVLTGALATRVLLDGRRAAGVRYVHEGREETAACAREVILAAGVFNSPQLLMLSGIGPGSHLRGHGIETAVDLPGVGQNLEDHFTLPMHVRSRQPVSLYSAESVTSLLRYLLLRRGMLASNVAEGAAFVRASPDLEAPDLELIFAPVLYVDEGLAKPPEHGFTIGSVAVQPKSVGSVALRSPDPADPPVIEPRYLSNPDDLRVIVEGVKLARRVAATKALAAYAGEELLPGREAVHDEEIEAAVRRKGHCLYHAVGTCRMGADEAAVVDHELRLRGVEGLRVADASVMPVIPRGHTDTPTVMIAEKAADLIRSDGRVRAVDSPAPA